MGNIHNVNEGIEAKDAFARRHWRVLAVMAVPITVAMACQSGRSDLAEELRIRGSKEGFAIVRPRTNWFEIIPFGTGAYSVRNPRGLSTGWIAQDGDFVAWNIHATPGGEFAPCASAITIETPSGELLWQVPGSVTDIRAMAVSPDGRRLAFDGTYLPASGSASADTGREVNPSAGVHYVDVRTQKVLTILHHALPQSSAGGISWSPGSEAFAYESGNRIYVWDLAAGVSRAIRDGQNPTWSPNGDWIAFKSPDGWATVVNPVTLVSRRLLQHAILRSVHWSPDSRYVLVSEPLGPLSNFLNGRSVLLGPSAELVVYRLSDGARVSVDLIDFKGGDDRSFGWVKNLATFMQGAAKRPLIQPCLPER